jgi:2-polyprenyl-3-methyl-5-hydroxy-6-metoxy-1,4-benzoquinol methylase
VSPGACPICGADRMETAHVYTAAPAGETSFPSLRGQDYRRRILSCRVCGHFVSACDMDISRLYDEEYVNATYKDAAGVRDTFVRITSLAPEKSDNAGRVERICKFFGEQAPGDASRDLLDIGSGLAVFPWAMKRRGWSCTALDPDPRAAAHAKEVAGVESICADFLKEPVAGRFSLVTLNKVLEHVPDPAEMLARAGELLGPGGVLYIEVPDGEAAAADAGFGREEFFLEHLHIFSAASTAILVHRASLRLLRMERLREPSGKFTLCAFLKSS